MSSTRRLRARSTCSVMPASVGPMPSCSSRRSVRRSSSRAATMRSRARCRSEVRRTACSAWPGVLGEVGEHAAVLGSERVLARAQAEHELPDLGSVMRERQRRPTAPVSCPWAARRSSLPVLLDLDRGVRQAQRLRDRLDDAGEHGLGRGRHLEAPREARDGRGGIVALAVEQAVDAALQPRAQRVEHDGHEAGGDDGGADADLLAAATRPRARSRRHRPRRRTR